MREIGTLVWVVLIIVGVLGSMISSVRKQAQARQPPPGGQTVPGPTPQPQRVLPITLERRPPPAPAAVRASQPRVSQNAPEPQVRRRRLFAGKNELVRAVIAAEVLGKPRGLSDEHFPR